MKIKVGQVWRDKKKGDLMHIIAKHHDVYWNCVFDRSKTTNHKMTEFTIKKYYELV